jgi:hypothetical protein
VPKTHDRDYSRPYQAIARCTLALDARQYGKIDTRKCFNFFATAVRPAIDDSQQSIALEGLADVIIYTRRAELGDLLR